MLQRGQGVVAVVVPFYRETLTSDEELSLKHLVHYLGAYDKYLIEPESLGVRRQGFEVRPFEDKFFRSAATYSALLLSTDFYATFVGYKYILIYQLDALVFSDQLTEWCQTNMDYIGAPWIDSPAPAVGNGGFSLRKVASCLRVLNALSSHIAPIEMWNAFYHDRPLFIRAWNTTRKELMKIRTAEKSKLTALNASRKRGLELMKIRTAETLKGPAFFKEQMKGAVECQSNEDMFWSYNAVDYYPSFRIPSVEVALRFAFEVEPRRCFKLNNNQLPFGCHAWERYDREFWTPYLLK